MSTINSKIQILYVEDDEITRENGVEFLENYFEKIYEAKNGLEALKVFNEIKPQIIITDIQMPKIDGLEFIKKVREKDSTVQIIVLTAFSHKDYLLKAIELHLIKYLIKPIKEYEFKNALELCIKNIENSKSNIIKLTENCFFDKYNFTLLIDEQIIKLRAKEIDLLALLLENKNRIVSYEEIENFVWKDTPMTKDALKSLIKYLKQKLPKDTLTNLTGVGYKIDV